MVKRFAPFVIFIQAGLALPAVAGFDCPVRLMTWNIKAPGSEDCPSTIFCDNLNEGCWSDDAEADGDFIWDDDIRLQFSQCNPLVQLDLPPMGRNHRAYETIGRHNPDILALQEVHSWDHAGGNAKLRDILAQFPEYSRAVVETAPGLSTSEQPIVPYFDSAMAGGTSGGAGAGNPIIYRASRFEQVDWGSVYDCTAIVDGVTETHNWAGQAKINWVLFREKSSGQELLVYNVHFTATSAANRKGEVRRVSCDMWHKKDPAGAQYGGGRYADVPFFLMGDLNSSPGSKLHEFLRHEGFGYAFINLFGNPFFPDPTSPPFSHVEMTPSSPTAGGIDWIYGEEGMETQYEVKFAPLTHKGFTSGGSDHSPRSVLVVNADPEVDSDFDSWPDACDNCLIEANQHQVDADLDGLGNACDGDLDQNGVVDANDQTAFDACTSQAANWSLGTHRRWTTVFGGPKFPANPTYVLADIGAGVGGSQDRIGLDPDPTCAESDLDGDLHVFGFGSFPFVLGTPPGPSGLDVTATGGCAGLGCGGGLKGETCPLADLDSDCDGVNNERFIYFAPRIQGFPAQPMLAGDNCPHLRNPYQGDGDDDGVGDACDGDFNNDGQVDGGDEAIILEGWVNCFGACDPALHQKGDMNDDGVVDWAPDGADYALFVLARDHDADRDGVPNPSHSGVFDVDDNCPVDGNTDQADEDNDDAGDLCDNCVDVANASQLDTDLDSFGNACDADYDQNGFVDNVDFDILTACFGKNVPPGVAPDEPALTHDPTCGESDMDGSGVVTIADLNLFRDQCGTCTDVDGDGIPNAEDNCRAVANPDQSDSDTSGPFGLTLDGVGDACDNCIFKWNPNQKDSETVFGFPVPDGYGDACEPGGCTVIPGVGTICDSALPCQGTGVPGCFDECGAGDTDNDMIPNYLDNCIPLANNQDDLDGNGVGDACDAVPSLQGPSGAPSGLLHCMPDPM